MTDFLPEHADGLPNLCGSDRLIDQAVEAGGGRGGPAFLPDSDIDFANARAGFAVALHMHQPLVPAGGGNLQTAEVVSHLRFMLDHPELPDAHNAAAFLHCYRRMGEIIPALLAEGHSPRVMLDYSGCLLHGLRQMGADDVLDALRPLAQDPGLRRCVEWLGTAWGHAVAPSTPAGDFRRHVRAWQHHFAAMFGLEALGRVRGFSPPEMALPNHPDACHAFVRTLRECGYRWVLVQEHTVERADEGEGGGGGPVVQPHVPHRLVAHDSAGRAVSIVAVVKTRGSDTKLVGQMQPYAKAKGLPRAELGGRSVPQLVTQIGDGENGGVMMNEFPSAYCQAMREASATATPPMNVSQYLEHLAAAGVREADFPAVQPAGQQRIWDRLGGEGAGGSGGPERLAAVIDELRREDGRFHVEGGSWTADVSWVRGYEGVLGPMAAASARFAAMEAGGGLTIGDPRYRRALFHLLLSETSCFRYWGSGRWTEWGRELCRRAEEALLECP